MSALTRRSATSRALPLGLACLGLALSSCASRPPAYLPVEAVDELESSLYLIGDAGAPAPREPVLKALSAAIAPHPTRSVVVFLGDNVYPLGMPSKGARGRKEAERRLEAQLAVVRDNGAWGIFLPGNHDWAAWGPDGWDAVRRQGRYVADRGAPAASFLPEDGCPGPVVRDVEEKLRLILLDTQWWLHAHRKPQDPTSNCPADSEVEVLDALAEAIKAAEGRHVVVAGHHPLASGGAHGGYFSWTDHIFPLRAKRSWLWIPLPGIGSAYPLARRRGVSDQDLSGLLNRKMREGIEGVFAKSEPLVYASGHEHNLQVLKGKDVKYLLVSGAGYYGHLGRTASSEATLFAREASGFMRLDVGRKGRVRLAVLTVDAQGKATEGFSRYLE